ncbi:MAG: hypothetical protein ACO3C4_01805 [Candidatus Limnocylindrus sp.]
MYRELLEHALEQNSGQLDFEAVVSGVEAGLYQAWLAPSSIAVTTIDEYPLSKICTVVLGAGNLSECRDVLLPKMEQFAKGHGCSRLMIVGRAGWEKALPGFKRTAVISEKVL